MSEITISNTIFFDEIAVPIAAGEKVIIHARGNSMRPFIKNNKDKLVLEKPGEDSFTKGAILLAKLDKDKFVAHRMYGIQNGRILLRGDGNIYTKELCDKKDIIAEVTAIIRNERKIVKNSFLWKLHKFAWLQNVFVRKVLLALFT